MSSGDMDCMVVTSADVQSVARVLREIMWPVCATVDFFITTFNFVYTKFKMCFFNKIDKRNAERRCNSWLDNNLQTRRAGLLLNYLPVFNSWTHFCLETPASFGLICDIPVSVCNCVGIDFCGIAIICPNGTINNK